MIPQALAVANGKGGVGKTSVAANLAGEMARMGRRTLVVDLDPQGNLGSDLGYRQHPLFDNGQSLVAAALDGDAAVLLQNVRPRLDAVAGGRNVRRLADALTVMSVTGASDPDPLVALLHDLAEGFDSVVIDCPPTGSSIVDSVIDSVSSVLVPVKADDASLDGLEMIARSFARSRSGPNPGVRLLGIVTFDSATSAHAIRADLRKTVEADLGGIAPVFESFIRRSERSAYDMRRFGMLAHEYAARAEEVLRTTSVRTRIEASRRGDAASRFSTAARGLADDYRNLAREVVDAWLAVAA